MQGYALVIFTAPFVIFAAPAGWLADRFAKRRVIIGAKALELVAMLFGAAGICYGNWWLIFAMLAMMGIQAAAFSPALNGSIPELYPADYVIKANGILRLFITGGILAGIALAGFALDRQGPAFRGIEFGRLLVGGGVIAVALTGLLISLGVPSRPAADPVVPFPWRGPVRTIQDLLETRRDPKLGLTVLACVFIWLVGSLEVLLINTLGIDQFQLTKTATSGLIVDQLVGVGIGGLLSGKLVSAQRWHRLLGPSGIAMSLAMLALPVVPRLPPGVQVSALYILMGLIGVAGGMFMIPVEGFIQIRPARERKGAILAAVNFIVFIGILLSGLISNALNYYWRPTDSFGVVGAISLVISAALLYGYARAERKSP
jgi:MFS family permease